MLPSNAIKVKYTYSYKLRIEHVLTDNPSSIESHTGKTFNFAYVTTYKSKRNLVSSYIGKVLDAADILHHTEDTEPCFD